MDIIKNPIIVGLTMGALTYCYLSWTVNEKNEQNEKKKKGKRKEKETVNLLIPLVVAIIAWFIAYAYFEYSVDTNDPNQRDQLGIATLKGPKGLVPIPLAPSPKFGFVGDVLSDSTDNRFTLVGDGVQVPVNLPDVLLDIN